MPPRLSRLLALPALAFALGAADVQADERATIEQLQRSGRTADALQRADRAVAAEPRDPALRFLRGVLLAESGRTAEAADVYVALTEEYPELPEPYNNLAVIHAAAGRLDQARVALETALRYDPAYAAAHENLGDVYLQLAVRSFERAAAHNADTKAKLNVARQLLQAPRTGMPGS